ncbi:lytic transglycosylase domain-containing protein [Blastochloris sulfoviridis]|uniref:Lytic transglycosylase domain-containing protein n=1 Tax=Blastochloris sulfoviridis TaxID=50712 RepID=A0A5M6HT37_9HYPH|nr:lytic transglycosylase domain-containing protein [Blastochloris sulfoviridis]KAA5598951.1 lytic transglycosylase domain-containing protein [Blastochloris sulfoviridis]
MRTAATLAILATVLSPLPAAASSDSTAVAQAIQLIERGRGAEADQIAATLRDPAARKTIEWMRLRRNSGDVRFERFATFARENPGWPSVGLIRKRAEGKLWEDRASARTIFAYFGQSRPTSGKGKLALARAHLETGNQAAAQALVREAWREEPFSKDGEDDILRVFGPLLGRADHKARTDMFLYAEDGADALRNAARVGSDMVAVAKARIAAIKKDKALAKLLNAVPASARNEPSYIYARSQFHRRADKPKLAAEWVFKAPSDPKALVDTDQWWIERRLLVRHLLEENEPRTAYRMAAGAAMPEKENYKVERDFMAGWVALRFLNDPATARRHFARILQLTNNPTSEARGHYWLGRAAEATGDRAGARAAYEKGARVVSAYYGQLSRAKLGRTDLPVPSLPRPSAQGRAAFLNSDTGRALQILHDIGRSDLTVPMYAELGERIHDPDRLAALAEFVAQRKDARAMLLVGRDAINRGLPFEAAAFPAVGLPSFPAREPAADLPVVYAIARQESAFNPATVSSANALGFMQVTPAAGRYVAKKFGLPFDAKRLLSDPVYNMQMGALEIGDLIRDYDNNMILAFAGYNAGRGRVRDWVARFGDPRDPKVDPVDWVEKIPFFETRNYVQRVLENLQIYRVRFSGRQALHIEADLRTGR